MGEKGTGDSILTVVVRRGLKQLIACYQSASVLTCSVCAHIRSLTHTHARVRALAAAAVTTLVVPSATPASSKCPKCATNNAGKLTCCASGGSWFKNCGDPGDPAFDHTWQEGVQACKGTLMGVNGCK